MLPWIATALAGTVYLNQTPVPAEVLAQIELQQVDVRVEHNGDVWVTAPGYAWRDGELIVPGYTANVAPAGWWLVIEDQRSRGLTVEVRLNGSVVKRMASGESNRLVPIGDLVRAGANEVVVSVSGSRGAAGRIAVFTARGRSEGSLMVVDDPPTRWVIGPESLNNPIRYWFDAAR